MAEISNRTVQALFLLAPSRELNELLVGVLGRALQHHPVHVVALVCLSNHFHAILWAEDAETMSDFMAFFGGNLAREAGRLHGWRDKFWARRYQSIPISNEPEIQIARFKYVLAHSVKEHLVPRSQDWPGVHSAGALLRGEPLIGVWIDRTALYEDRQRGRAKDLEDYVERYEVHLAKLPCWADLSDEEYRAAVGDLLAEIEEEHALERLREGISLPSRKSLLEVDPRTSPEVPKRSPCPQFHAATHRVREEMRSAYRWFAEAYRAAAAALRSGDRQAAFPEGSFPPALPFCRHGSLEGATARSP